MQPRSFAAATPHEAAQACAHLRGRTSSRSHTCGGGGAQQLCEDWDAPGSGCSVANPCVRAYGPSTCPDASSSPPPQTPLAGHLAQAVELDLGIVVVVPVGVQEQLGVVVKEDDAAAARHGV